MKQLTMRWMCVLLGCLLIVALAGCGASEQPAPQPATAVTTDEEPTDGEPAAEADATNEVSLPVVGAEESSESYPAPSSAEGYPAPTATIDPYPGQDPTPLNSPVPAGPLEVPAPAEGTANIGGTLLRITPDGNHPIEGAVLYLGEIALNSEGERAVAGFFEQSSPRTGTNAAGQFIFENVEPGEYTLFYWTPSGSVLLLDPETQGDLIFTVEAGDALNLGELPYDLPQ